MGMQFYQPYFTEDEKVHLIHF